MNKEVSDTSKLSKAIIECLEKEDQKWGPIDYDTAIKACIVTICSIAEAEGSLLDLALNLRNTATCVEDRGLELGHTLSREAQQYLQSGGIQ